MKSLFCCLLMTLFHSILVAQPLDDIVERSLIKNRKMLEYQPIREADIMWEKRIWRVIDVREKMNLPFSYPLAPFFKILETAALEGTLTVYSAEDDQFLYEMNEEEVRNTFFKKDTFEIISPTDFTSELRVVENILNFQNVKRFRIKEIWYFDENTSTMKVRILGIAPLIEVFDDNDNFKFERPLFWVYYNDCREIFAQHAIFNADNDRAQMSWEDLFEMRMFSSYIYKSSNVRNDRIRDYASGIDMLLEADKIKAEIFNFEHDLWSY